MPSPSYRTGATRVVRDTGGQNGVLGAPMRASGRNAQAGFTEGLAMRLWTVWTAHRRGRPPKRQTTEEAVHRRGKWGKPERAGAAEVDHSLTKAWRATTFHEKKSCSLPARPLRGLTGMSRTPPHAGIRSADDSSVARL